MKRLVLPFLLVLSLGVNIGLVLDRFPDSDRGAAEGDAAAGETAARETAVAGATDERPMPPRLQRRLERMAGELSLAGEERERFLELQGVFFRRSSESGERMRHARRALRLELLSQTPDRARAEAYLGQANAAQAAIEQAFVDNYFDTRSLLETPEQIRRFQHFMKRVRQLRQEMERRMDERRGRRLGERQPPRRNGDRGPAPRERPQRPRGSSPPP